MKRILNIFLLMWFSLLSVYAQTEGYNPSNPPNPDAAFKLTIKAIPEGAGSAYFYDDHFIPGQEYYVGASANTYYRFEYWQDEKGDTISTFSSFYYTMPDRNVELTAVFVPDYNPMNPGNPAVDQYGNKKCSLTILSKPEGVGSFSPSGTVDAVAGMETYVYAYTLSNFSFIHWEDENGNVLSTEQSLQFNMPEFDTKIYGVYEYNPSNPSNPHKNSWDKTTGEVIVDDFQPDYLSSAIYDVVNGDQDAVSSIIASGKISRYDFSIANSFSSCIKVDMSRTSGADIVPSWCYYGNSNLAQIILPSSIGTIEGYAFYDCSALADLTLYSMMPPSLGYSVFEGVPDGLMVHVPMASMELYEQAEGWKDLIDAGRIIIMPILGDVHSLEVDLPLECADGRYKNMPLELINVKSGQKYKYVITDRVNYIFSNLVKDTQYEAVLKNLSGTVLARIENINIENEDVVVAFDLDDMKQLRTVSAQVKDADGIDVTSSCNITWYDANGTYLAQGTSLAGQVSESKVKFSVNLSQSLAMEYALPTDSLFEVQESDNTVICRLSRLPMRQLSGRVIDVTTQQALNGVTVSISQTLNGRYSKSYNVKTDKNGAYAAEVFAAPTTLSFASADYISQSHALSDEDLTKSEIVLSDVKLKAITGATISVGFTYTNSVVAGATPEVQNSYSDYNNVTYNIYNVSAGREITQFNVQNSSIVLLEEVNEGDSLRIVAKSKKDAFMDVTTGGRIDNANRMSITVPVVQLGGIQSTFTATDNNKVLGILYDSNGIFVNKYNYGSATLNISGLKDGDYTLVSMGESDFFGSIYNLNKFADAGLTPVLDYVQNKVTVKSGVISTIKNQVIPYFDDTKFYYTGENTSFTVNKSSVVAGNYLTLTAKVDFKDVYAENISDVAIAVELPEGSSLVNNSVMVGTSLSEYELNDNLLIIPLNRSMLSQRVRFCVIPSHKGKFVPSATAQFSINGKKISQPIGNATCDVKSMSINVPGLINDPQLTVSGTSMPKATVYIYDDNELIGQTVALSNGYWSVSCELSNPYNLSTHRIYAKIVSEEGVEFLTETGECQYDRYKIKVKNVLMSFYNAWMRQTVSVTWDFLTGKTSSTSYSFYTTTDFTFVADLTSNREEAVSALCFNVMTDNGKVTTLYADYDAKLNRWVATGSFGNDGLPVNLNVSVWTAGTTSADRRQFDDLSVGIISKAEEYATIASEVKDLEQEVINNEEEIEKTQEELNTLIVSIQNATDDRTIESLLVQFLNKVGANYSVSDFEVTVPAEADQAFVDELVARAQSLIDSSDSFDFDVDVMLTDIDNIISSVEDDFDLETSLKTASDKELTLDTENGKMQVQRLSLQEFILSEISVADTVAISMSDESGMIALLSDNNEVVVIDSLRSEVLLVKSLDVASKTRALIRRAKSSGDFVSAMNEARQNIQWLYNSCISFVNNMLGDCKDHIARLTKAQDDLSNTIVTLSGENAGRAQRVAEIEKELNRLRSKEVLEMEEFFEYYNKSDLIQKLEAERAKNLDNIKKCQKSIDKLKTKTGKLTAKLKVTGAVLGELMDLYQVIEGFVRTIQYIGTAISDHRHWFSLIDNILPCPDDNENAVALDKLSRSNWTDIAWKKGYYPAFMITGVATIVNGYMMANKGAKFVAKFLVGVITDFLSNTAEVMYNQARDASLSLYPKRYAEYRKLKCKKTEDPDDPNSPDRPRDPNNPNDPNDPPTTPFNPVSPIHDPSGYVYEGVSTNRIQGVTATAYYWERSEDMYGDFHEGPVKWDAEEYAQKNPLFTDENGMYQWDVPEGLWQVKFEKEGYVTTYSDWLPVPPPQMDVNVAMVQNAQPEVVMAHAYEDGVELEFSKYMNIETLNADNIKVKVVNGEDESLVEDATIELLNEEVSMEGSEVSYASKVKLVTDQLAYYDEAYVIVSNNVNSYAGIPMAEVYQQKLDIEKKVRELAVEETYKVAYGGDLEVTIAALPVEAAAGKKIRVSSASEMIATVDAEELTLDADGQASFKITGELLGTTALNFSLVDADLEATSIVNVLDPKMLEAVQAPTASRISGTSVYRGQTVTLSCASEGATIYYTTDGTCPCDVATRIKYERPIVINEAMTLKIMAVGVALDESEVKEYTYGIRQSTVAMNLSEGWNWNSHDLDAPLQVEDLEAYASRVQTQTKEAINDPVIGLVGNLSEIEATEAVKIEALETALVTFDGDQFNPAANTITLNTGWNWLGYPLDKTMTLADAFANLNAEEGDFVTSLEGGVAEYSEGTWKGTLEVMQPGLGYLYKSASNKTFVYNDMSTVNARALYGHKLVTKAAPRSVNKHRYPSMMNVIATLFDDDETMLEGVYHIAAFNEDECRGIGTFADGIVYLSVYGDTEVPLNFVLSDADSGETYTIVEQLKFVPDVLGSGKNPFILHVGQATGLSNVQSEVQTDFVFDVFGQRVKKSSAPRGIYIENGNKLLLDPVE